MTLQDILTIHTGRSIRGRIEPVSKKEGSFKLLQMKDIDASFGAIKEDLVYIKNHGKKSPDFLEKDNIVFVGRGFRGSRLFSAVHISKNLDNTVAAPQLLVLKLKHEKKNEILPAYISWYINSRYAQNYFHKEAVGTSAIINISKASLEKLKIQLPTLERQKLIVKMYDLFLKEKQITKQIMEKKNKLIDQILIDAL